MNKPNPKSNPQAVIPALFADPSYKPQVTLVRWLNEGSFLERCLLGAQAMAAELGIRLTTFNADGDLAAMAALIERAIQDGADAIIIDHGQTDVLQPAVEAALEQGVPVVTFDLVIDHPDVPEIEQDDMLIGFKLAQKLVADCAGRANVIYVNAEGYTALEKRDRPWQDFKWRYPGLKELALLGPVTQQTAADTGEQLQTLLQEHPDTTAVLAMWDEFAKGAMQAITQSNLSPQIRLYSVDITDEDIQLMTEAGSPWVATVATDAYNIGRLALRTATALIAGEKVDKYLLVEPQLITQEFLVNNRIANMDELIQVLPTLGESRLVWFDWMEPLLARNGYHIPAVTLPPEQLLEQLQTTLTSLQWRNVELQAAAEVSRAASSILDPDELIQRAIDLIRERFDLYYAGLFLVDEANEWAVLHAGSSEAGRAQIERGHKLKVGGDSMIGQCVVNAQARIVPDVGEDTGHFANPWLPDARSKMVLPLVSRDQIIGAMTIQSTQEFAFFEEDIAILQTIADQLANAISNARLFRQVTRRAEQLQAMADELAAAKERADEARGAAEAANRAKSDFLARMSHEIRTPMNAIIGMTNLTLKTELNTIQKDYLGKAYEASHHLLRIIDDILDFSKIEAGRLELRSTDFLLHQVIDKTANMFRIKAADKQIELFYIIDSDVPLALKGDPLRVGQILINLISNAVKFTDKGEIIVRVGLYENEEKKPTPERAPEPDRVNLLFSVQDSGIGIPPDKLETLFQPFTQVDDSITRAHEGTGLGLVICQRLVAMMGGRIWGESEPGKGATFSFTLTLERQAEEIRHALHSPPDIRGMNVLAVDDRETARQILQEMLCSFDFNVTTVASGPQGLVELEQAARTKPYDLIIIDWKMPEMDGFELAHKIHTHPVLGKEGITPRMIMITMYGWEEFIQAQKSRATEIDGYLLKPVSSSELFNTIMEVFGKADAMVPRGALDQESVDLAGLQKIRGARVLLVEDNEINQQVATAILKGIGLLVEVVSTGAEAVEMMTESEIRFDAVLMDIQMPVMDGYEATKQIRRAEEGSGKQSTIPIIAMTAHALKGDREKCLEAGMNDYISKPIDERELYAALVKWIPPGKREIPEEYPSHTEFIEEPWQGMPASIAGIDLQAGLKRIRGNTGLFKQLLRSFLHRSEHAADTIDAAIKAGNLTEAQRLTHAIKGVSGNLGAQDLFKASRELNDLLRENKTDGLTPLLETFVRTLTQVVEALKGLNMDDDTGASVSQEPEAINPEQVTPILRKMQGLLEKNSSRARHCLPPLKAALRAPQFREHLNRLNSAVYALDFKEAISVLEDIANTLNSSLKEGEQ